MKILLQNIDSGLYLSRGGNWTSMPEAALAFLDEIRAKDYSIYHRLADTRVFIMPDTPAPTPVPAPNTTLSNDTIMNATKNRDRTNKSAEMNSNRLQSIEESVIANQVSAIATAGKGRKPASVKRRLSQTPSSVDPLTLVEAKIDVGFGNALFIRGQGAELSWDKGLPLKCSDGSTWVWSTTHAKGKLAFKLLLNDQIWAKGEDVVINPGGRIQITPTF